MLREESWRNGAAQTALGLAVVLLAGCSTFQVPSFSDYVGPAEAPSAATRPTTTTAPAAETRLAEQTGPLEITIREAILVALENNKSLAVQRFNPDISRQQVQVQRAAFDPDLTAGTSVGRTKAINIPPPGLTAQTNVLGNVALEEFLPTGTDVKVSAAANAIENSNLGDDITSTRLGMTVTQALLQGASLDANLASLREARLNVLTSQYELRGFAESLLGEVESAYWDYALAIRQIEIFTDSLKIAEAQLAETQERIKIGKLAETEEAAAQAEVAQRRELLIDGKSRADTLRIQLLRLLSVPTNDTGWDREVILENQPVVPDVRLDDVESHVQVAMRMRPDLNQARLAIERDELEVVRTANGLLPKLDLFITLGKTGYARSFGHSINRLDDDFYDVLGGVSFEQPPLNRQARAQHRQAVLTRKQAMEALDDLAQLVEVDVRTAYIEVVRTKEQIGATAVTLKFREASRRAEEEKFRVGKSTSLLVAAAQRDLLQGQLDNVQAIINHLKALIALHRLEGSLLERRGIQAPGNQPIVLNAKNS
jgi:outer membrane protein